MVTAKVIANLTTPARHAKAEGYNYLVGGTWFRNAATPQSPLRIYTKDSLAQRTDRAGSPYENVLDIGYVFGRTDLSGGEGLDWSPRQLALEQDQAALDEVRFWDSKNISIRRPERGQPYSWCLSPRPEVWRTEAGLVDLATSDDYLYVAFGNTVQWWANWNDAGPVDSQNTSTTIAKIVAAPTGDILAQLTDGTVEVFVFGSPGFVPVPGVTTARNIWYAKGRFILCEGTVASTTLREVQGTIVLDRFDSLDADVHSIVSSGPAIVAACSDGTLRSYVPEQANQIDPASVNLVIRGRTEMPEGEVPYLLGSNASTLLVLTRTTNEGTQNTIRCYRAEVLDARFDYVIGQLQLKRQWDDAFDVIDKKQNMASSREEIFFFVQEAVDEDSVWRFDLVTEGLSRHVVTPSTVDISIVIFDSKAGYVSGDDIWYSGDSYLDEGYVITPNVNFGLNTDISWLATTIRALNIETSGKQVELYYSTDPTAITNPDVSAAGPWKILARISAPGQAELDQPIIDIESRSIALQFRLYSTENQTRTPCITSFALRGIPIQRDYILELPINVSDIVEVPGRMPVKVPSYGDILHKELLSKVGTSLDIDVLDPPFLFTGIIDQIMEPTTYVSERGASSVRCVIQCRGSERVSSASSVGDSGLGLGTLGIGLLGLGQSGRT